MSTSRRFPRIAVAALVAIVMITNKGPLLSQATESATAQAPSRFSDTPGLLGDFPVVRRRDLSLIMTDPPNARSTDAPAPPDRRLLQAVLGATVANPVAVIVEKKRYNGVRIYGVLLDGAADQAGLKKEDIILAIDGVPVTNTIQLMNEVHRHKPGDKVIIKFFRDPTDQIQAVNVTLDGIFIDMGPLRTTSFDHRARRAPFEHQSDPGRLAVDIACDHKVATEDMNSIGRNNAGDYFFLSGVFRPSGDGSVDFTPSTADAKSLRCQQRT